MNAAEAKARKMMAMRTTSQLLNDWDATEAAKYTPELPTVRGWIMDELEVRNPEAFIAWMEDENPYASPRTYYAA